ncbi:MAG: alpha/beta hydrolase [Pseudomonadota bacterium]
MDSYDGSESWQTYRALVEDQFGVPIERTPAETWRLVRAHDLHIDEWDPEGVAKGTLILVHGGGGNGRVLAPFADFAAGLGWRVLAPDLPGYGLTRPAPDYRWDYDEWPAIIAELADEADGPVVLMGLSVGGMTAAFAAEMADKVRGVIATTLLDMSDPTIFARSARWRLLGSLSLIGFKLMPWIIDRVALPLRYAAPMHAMSDNKQMAEFFAHDPLLGGLWVPSRFFRTMHKRKVGRIETGCPVLLVHPGADVWTPADLSLQALDQFEPPKDHVVLTNGSHLPLERPAIDELRDHVRHFLAAVETGSAMPAAG